MKSLLRVLSFTLAWTAFAQASPAVSKWSPSPEARQKIQAALPNQELHFEQAFTLDFLKPEIVAVFVAQPTDSQGTALILWKKNAVSEAIPFAGGLRGSRILKITAMSFQDEPGGGVRDILVLGEAMPEIGPAPYAKYPFGQTFRLTGQAALADDESFRTGARTMAEYRKAWAGTKRVHKIQFPPQELADLGLVSGMDFAQASAQLTHAGWSVDQEGVSCGHGIQAICSVGAEKAGTGVVLIVKSSAKYASGYAISELMN